MSSDQPKRIEVLGPGCARCQRLAENAQAALVDLGIQAAVVKITDINVITGYGVMMTPALAVDGQVKVAGKVASPEEIKGLLQ